MFSEWTAFITSYVNGLVTSPSIKILLGIFLATSNNILGLSHSAVQALMLLMVCDYILGAAHAWKDNRLEFSRLRRGLGKFIVYGFAINITWLADVGMDTETLGFSLRNLLCAYLSANEALSALTHLAQFGFPFPVWLKDRLLHYRDSIGRLPSSNPSESKDRQKNEDNGRRDS